MMNCKPGNKNYCESGRREHMARCGCHETESGFQRRYVSKAEVKEKLEKYQEDLKKELRAVEDQIKQLSTT
ncbi:MAG: DUF5320 domain-containing protein [Spirochaetaceae bacterium]|nr:DUF5320 domain-containing protein [Spirochaetaceae bacterium]